MDVFAVKKGWPCRPKEQVEIEFTNVRHKVGTERVLVEWPAGWTTKFMGLKDGYADATIELFGTRKKYLFLESN